MKNPTPKQLAAGIESAERRREEKEFFLSTPGKDLGIDQSRAGVEGLQVFLQSLLEEHIERELPQVCDDIDALLRRVRSELNNLGDERATIKEQKNFLFKLSMDLRDVIQAGLNGSYHSTKSDFFKVEKNGLTCNRLRGNIHELNNFFATYMRDESHMRKRDVPEPVNSDIMGDIIDVKCDGHGSSSGRFGHLGGLKELISLSKTEIDSWIKKVCTSLFFAARGLRSFISAL